jgi:hypothetical protein
MNLSSLSALEEQVRSRVYRRQQQAKVLGLFTSKKLLDDGGDPDEAPQGMVPQYSSTITPRSSPGTPGRAGGASLLASSPFLSSLLDVGFIKLWRVARYRSTLPCDDDDDGDGAQYTNMTPASCSFYSHTPHLLLPLLCLYSDHRPVCSLTIRHYRWLTPAPEVTAFLLDWKFSDTTDGNPNRSVDRDRNDGSGSGIQGGSEGRSSGGFNYRTMLWACQVRRLLLLSVVTLLLWP